MLISRKISEVQIGGNGADNPSPFSDSNFQFSSQQLLLRYTNVNAIIYHNRLGINQQVTCKVQLDSSGNPMMGPNDLIHAPCPPFCQAGD
jgi:hypothetical protein